MIRLALCASTLLIGAVTASAQESNLTAQGWWVGNAEAIAASHPTVWDFVSDPAALKSDVTDLTCPQILSNATLTAAKGSDFTAECWYQTSEREGVWATSLDSVDLARETLSENYASIPSDPDIELAPLEVSMIGPCRLEVRRMRNTHGFWVTLRDLYAPDAFHQFRTFTYEEARRSEVERLAQELLDVSLSTKCAGIS